MHNLQNVGVQRSGSAATAPHSIDTSSQRPTSAADLAALFQRKPSAPGGLQSPMAGAGAEQSNEAAKGSGEKGNPQDMLLNLLKGRSSQQQGKPSARSSEVGSVRQSIEQPEQQQASVDKLAQSFADSSLQQSQRESTPARQFGSPSPGATTEFKAPQPNKFNYINPFDQLHASSPLNRSPAPPTHASALLQAQQQSQAQGQDRKIEILKHDRTVSDKHSGSAEGPATKSRKIASPEPAVKQEPVSSPKPHQSVSEKLEGVGQKVDAQVEKALAQADGPAQRKSTPGPAEMKKEEVQAADDDVDSNWSTAESLDAKNEEEAKVEVYNFPMKPFVTLQLSNSHTARGFLASTWEAATPIARLKKDFSHDDRCLATASQAHIVYPCVPTPKKPETGFKIIRQDDGKNKTIFASAKERVCSVQIVPAGEASDVEAVLAAGVNGSVFYTTLSKSSNGDEFAEDDVESQGFFMPALPSFLDAGSSSDFSTSSAIRTRAKLSTRHPNEYFAVARGRQIHIVAPDLAKDTRYVSGRKPKKVNSEKYVQEHSLSINTGKAGKDFCWSEDDTVITSLDKTGRVKFWDVRALTVHTDPTNPALSGPQSAQEIKEPLYSFTAAAVPNAGGKDEKMSPSSVIFLDKERPCTKGVALRYVLLGFAQNRVLQLWDLGLGKCVQELRFPENTLTDEGAGGMCSINYHPKTGIIMIGNPGRNSVYFIHLSAPRYNLPTMSQAQYLGLIATQDKGLPRPESTAIMSGMREYSLGKIGELRSVDMLKAPVQGAEGADGEGEDEVQFELYVMHSKGVVGLPIRRADLGWDGKGKMVRPVDGVSAGVLTVGDLVQGKAPPSEASSQAETPARRPSKREREAAKNETVKKEPAASPAPAAAATNGSVQTEFPGSKQVPEATNEPAQQATNPPLMTADSYAMAAQSSKPAGEEHSVPAVANAAKKVDQPETAPAATQQSSTTDEINNRMASVSISDSDIQAALSKQFDSLYQKLDQDKRVADAAGAAKQDAMLRLVSSTLTDNVESSLHRIVGGSIEEKVIPALTASTSKIVERKVGEAVSKQLLQDAVAKEMRSLIPGVVKDALKQPEVSKAIAQHVVDEVAKHVNKDVSGMLQRSMSTQQTHIVNLTTQSSQQMQKTVADMEARLGRQLQEAETQRQESSAMIASLSANLRSLTELVEGMKTAQAQQQALQPAGGASKTIQEIEPEPEKEPEDPEIARIIGMLQSNDFEGATIEVRNDRLSRLLTYANDTYSGYNPPARPNSSTISSFASTPSTSSKSLHSSRSRCPPR